MAVLTQLDNGREAVWTARPDGSQQRKVIEEEGVASPRWSPAGDAIYLLRAGQGDAQDLVKVDIDPKSGRANNYASLLLSGLQAGDHFTMSTDGTRLAYLKVQGYSNLWLARSQSTENRREPGKGIQGRPLTTGTSVFLTPTISPDGGWIAYVTAGHIYKMPMEGGTPTQLTFSTATDFSPAWSPDGKRIAFGSNEGGTYKVWMVDADGSNRRQFAKTRISEDARAQVGWSPGRCIFYQKPGNRTFNILDPDTGEEKPLIRNESVGWLFNPQYSSDGSKVAVLWNRPLPHSSGPVHGLWVISLIDGSETLLSEGWYLSRRMVAGRRLGIRVPWQRRGVDTCGPGEPRYSLHCSDSFGRDQRRQRQRGRQKVRLLRGGGEVGCVDRG
jgi:Tol biopolymer transport system component